GRARTAGGPVRRSPRGRRPPRPSRPARGGRGAAPRPPPTAGRFPRRSGGRAPAGAARCPGAGASVHSSGRSRGQRHPSRRRPPSGPRPASRSARGVTEEDRRPPTDRAPRPVHTDRLRVPVWWWVLLAVVTAACVVQAVTIDALWWMWVVAVVIPVLFGWLFLAVGRERVDVESDGQGGGELYAGSAQLPFEAIARSAEVPATAKQDTMGRQLAPAA